MKIYQIRKETLVAAPLAEVWHFFSDPHNLQKITPPQLKFKVLECPDTDVLYEDMLIKYKIRPLLGIPMKWVTLIQEVRPMALFVDKQLSGPYRLWEHRHSFISIAGGTFMVDEVKYVLPLGLLGQLAHVLFVRRQLNGIFTYRQQVISALFPL